MGFKTGLQRRHAVVTILGWSVMISLIVVGLEVVFYFFLKKYVASRFSYFTYEPYLLPSSEEYKDYLTRRHPILGWPPIDEEEFGMPSVDDEAPLIQRARRVPTYAASNDDCITAYGDSFVYGSEVGDSEAWSNYLSLKLGCRAGNYGIAGYGTGQAFLRFKINGQDKAPVTYLGIHPYDFKRTVNQNRGFIGRSNLAFKPRYYLDRGKLKLASMPTIYHEDLVSFSVSPDKFLQHETFLPGSTLGPVPIRFSYSVKVFMLGLREDVRNWIAGRPAWSPYIQPGHSSNALEITVGIASEFMRECHARKKKCFIVLFPSKDEYEYYGKTGKRAIQPLLNELDHRNIPFLDLMPSFYKVLEGGIMCSILSKPAVCRGHYNAKGNRMVSEFLYEYLTINNYF